MVSLASYTTLYITAIRMEGADRLENITAVRFDGGYTGAEESSAGDLIRWLGRSDVRAYVRLPDGGRGPEVLVDHRGWPHLRSRIDDSQERDCLLTLPHLESGKAAKKPAHRRPAVRW